MNHWPAPMRRALPWVAVALAHAGAVAWLWHGAPSNGSGTVPVVAARFVALPASAPPDAASPAPAPGRPPAKPVSDATPSRTTTPVAPTLAEGAQIDGRTSIAAASGQPEGAALSGADSAPTSSADPVVDGSDAATPASPARDTAPTTPADVIPPTPDVMHVADAASDADGTSLVAARPTDWTSPPAGQWEYAVIGETRGLRYHASGSLLWQPAGERYRAELVLSAFWVGSRTQVSTGWLGPHGLRPERYEERVRRTRWLAFDWSADGTRATTLADAGQHQSDLPAGTQDRLGLLVQIGGTLPALALRAGQRLTWPVSGYSHWEPWTFEVHAATLALDGVDVPAWHLVRQRERPDELRIELWYPAQGASLPLRIVLQQANGDRVDQRLRQAPAATGANPAPPS